MEYISKEKLKKERHDIPTGLVHTRKGVFPCSAMTTLELQRYRMATNDMTNKDYVPAMIIILGCKLDGKPIFKDDDQLWLVELSADITDPVVTKILELTGISADDDDETAKNLTAETDGSESDSSLTTE